MIKRRYSIYLLSIFYVSSPYASLHSIAMHTTDRNAPWLTVFIHGTFVVKPQFLLGSIAQLVQDDIQGTMYAETVKTARHHPVFFKNQAMQELGLKKIDVNNPDKRYACIALARIFELLETKEYNLNNTNYYYTFGWSGLVSNSVRKQEAETLSAQLAQEVAQLHSQGIKPKIRLICYSHGGTLALNLADLSQSSALSIDELILMGTPIQSNTACLMEQPLFKKIYNIFSPSDSVQGNDFFSEPGKTSKQRVTVQGNYALLAKLIQVELRISATEPRLPNFKDRTIPWRYRKVKDPGHIELWFFGWTPRYYRKTFPLYPLPAAALIPSLLHVLSQYPRTTSHVIVDVNPHCDYISVTNANSTCLPVSFPFIAEHIFKELISLAKEYVPCAYKSQYKQQKYYAYQQALALHRFYKWLYPY
jgi:hypothetical protein